MCITPKIGSTYIPCVYSPFCPCNVNEISDLTSSKIAKLIISSFYCLILHFRTKENKPTLCARQVDRTIHKELGIHKDKVHHKTCNGLTSSVFSELILCFLIDASPCLISEIDLEATEGRYEGLLSTTTSPCVGKDANCNCCFAEVSAFPVDFGFLETEDDPSLDSFALLLLFLFIVISALCLNTVHEQI
jgi:hypothetical protein